MLTVMTMISLIKPHVSLIALLLVITSCARVPTQPLNSRYTIKVTKKRVDVNSTSIFGHIDEVYPHGIHHPVILAYVSVDAQGTKSNESGDYSFNSSPGKHDISVRCVGYQPVVIKGMHFAKNDSVQLDFHLAADTVKL